MAVRFNATGEYFDRTTDLPSTSTLSGCCWAYISTDTNDFSTIWSYTHNSTASQYCYVETDGTGTNLQFHYSAGGSPANTSGISLSASTWYHVCWVINSTCRIYVAAATAASYTSQTFSRPAGTPSWQSMRLGNNVLFGERWDGRVSAVKIWSGVELTEAEFGNERWSYLPKRTANLHLYSPILLHTDVYDYSGNGRSWTSNGTVSTEDGPPIAWSSAIRRRVHIVSGGGGGGAVPRGVFGKMLVGPCGGII